MTHRLKHLLLGWLIISANFLAFTSLSLADDPISLNPEFGWIASETNTSYSLAPGDVDGDGDLDLLVAVAGKNRLYFNQNGQLSPSADWNSLEDMDSLYAAWGDVDGDGDLDLAVANGDEGGLKSPVASQLYVNSGGNLVLSSNWGPVHNATSVAWGDVNGDGQLDLALSTADEATYVYLNTGLTLSQTPSWTSTDNFDSQHVAWGDMDGDSDLDLAIGRGDYASNTGASDVIYRNEGGTLSQTPVWTSTPNALTSRLAWGDINGDGQLDLVTAGMDDVAPLRLYLGNGSTLATNSSWASNEISHVPDLLLADMDNDGDLDVVAQTEGGGAGVRIYQNDSGTLSNTFAWTTSDKDFSSSVAVADLDNDNQPDLISGSFDNDKIYYNNGLPVAQTGRTLGQLVGTGHLPIEDQSEAIAWGDVDGDGDLDLAIGNVGNNSQLYLNNNGLLEASSTWLEDTYALAWGDVDGDGDLDLAITTRRNGNDGPSYLYNNLDGTLQTTPSWTSSNETAGTSLAWGDVNADGNLDLIVGAYNAPNHLYFNDAGRLNNISGWQNVNSSTTDLAWGDVDGDGDLDLVVANSFEPNHLYLNDDGQLDTTPNWLSTDDDDSQSVAWGDVDGDGDLDLAVGNQFGPNRIYFNHNGTLETQASWASQDADRTQDIALADIDGDGDLDLIAANGDSNVANKIYRNDGGQLNPSAAWVSNEAEDSQAISVGDMDGDGNLDVAFAQGDGQSDRIYLGGHASETGNINQGWGLRLNPSPLAPAEFLATATVNDDGLVSLSYSLFSPQGQAIPRLQVTYSTDGGGQWFTAQPAPGVQTTNLAASAYPTVTVNNTHVFTWDVYNSNFFGQSDNVILRLEAFFLPQVDKNAPPNVYSYPNLTGPTNQQVSISSQSYPFRVRGNQIRVISRTTGSNFAPVSSAVVYRLPRNNNTGATVYTRQSGEPFETDQFGYLQGQGQISLGDQLFALAEQGQSAGQTCQTFTASDLPQNISAERPNAITSTINVPLVGEVVDVNVVSLSGTHSYLSDLIFTLFNPSGNRTTLLLQACANANNFNLSLDDDANAAFPCPPTDGQRYQPWEPLEIFEGDQANGNWTLTVDDLYTSDGGQLQNWGLEICTVSNSGPVRTYHTNATPTQTGLNGFTVSQTGIQTLTISADKPLLLFDLDVSLEWDARHDPAYIQQLAFDLQRVAELMFNATNGQATLGELNIYHDKTYWQDADMVVFANNSLIPNATVGGVVDTDRSDDVISNNPFAISGQSTPYTITYKPGSVVLGSISNRFGAASGTAGEDRPRIMLHELGHYLFYLFDNYFGLDDGGNLIPVSTCTNSVMSNQFESLEFRSTSEWARDCAQTLSARRNGRSDWETITHFYPQLKAPTTVFSGPVVLPLDVTTIAQVMPATPLTTLIDGIFSLEDEQGATLLPGRQGQAVLFQYRNGQPRRMLDLGRAQLDKIRTYGASPGDRLCFYDLPRLGCETISENDLALQVVEKAGWQPQILISPVNSGTIPIQVDTGGLSGLNLQARLYPITGEPTAALTLTEGSQGYSGTFTLSDPATGGTIHVWVADDPDSASNPRREAITTYSLGGSPCPGCSNWPSRVPQNNNPNAAPAVSPDGQVLLYAPNNFVTGEFYALQKATRLPAALPWATQVGEGYYVLASAGAPPLDKASVNFRYRQQDVPPGEEAFLSLYYWQAEAQRWQKLPSVRNTDYNEVSALSQGPGLYVLMSSLEVELGNLGWNLVSYPVQSTRPITEAMASIDGSYALVYGYTITTTTTITNFNDVWQVYAPSLPSYANDLRALVYGRGYWISATEVITWQLKGTADEQRASQPPAPPTTYYGQVISGAGFVPSPGQMVEAVVGGVVCASGQTQLWQGQIVYSLKAPLSDTCANLGERVSFRVAGQPSISSSPLAGAWLRPLDLQFGEPQSLYLPIVLK